MKLIKTDHNEQALVVDQHTIFIIREALSAMLDNKVGSVEMRDEALDMKQFLESPDKDDRPAVFQKTHGTITKCPDCSGSSLVKSIPEDRNSDPEYTPCATYKGNGQLYIEVIRKAYIPTDYHRRKLTK